MLNDLLLLSGIDIPFPAAQVNIHQPTIKEIAYIGEENFFIGCELLIFSKDSLISEDKARLKDQSNFDIIMSIMKDKNNPNMRQNALSALMVLIILFPDYTVQVRKDYIALLKTVEQEERVGNEIQIKKRVQECAINNRNYPEFQQILIQMFCLTNEKATKYNPGGDLAQRIADKLKKGEQQRAAQKNQQNKIAVFSRYASILAVGEAKDLNSLMQYTVYQLFDEFQRYELKINYDTYVQAKMAGAKDLKEVDDWMKDIHSDSK